MNEIDLHEIGKGHLKLLGINLHRADEFFNSKPTNRIIHSNFTTFISNPIQMVQNIYQQLGYEFTDEYRLILEKYLEEDKVKRAELKKNDKRVPVTLEHYGVSKASIDDKFKWYYDKYLN